MGRSSNRSKWEQPAVENVSQKLIWVDQKLLYLLFIRKPFTEQPQNWISDHLDHTFKKKVYALHRILISDKYSLKTLAVWYTKQIGAWATLRGELEGSGTSQWKSAIGGDCSLPVGRWRPGPSEAQQASTAASTHWCRQPNNNIVHDLSSQVLQSSQEM